MPSPKSECLTVPVASRFPGFVLVIYYLRENVRTGSTVYVRIASAFFHH